MKNELNNGIAIYSIGRNGLINVKAMFHGNIEIVFQSYNKAEVIRYCHSNGMKAVSEKVYNQNACASFHKASAKHPYNPAEWEIGTVM